MRERERERATRRRRPKVDKARKKRQRYGFPIYRPPEATRGVLTRDYRVASALTPAALSINRTRRKERNHFY